MQNSHTQLSPIYSTFVRYLYFHSSWTHVAGQRAAQWNPSIFRGENPCPFYLSWWCSIDSQTLKVVQLYFYVAIYSSVNKLKNSPPHLHHTSICIQIMAAGLAVHDTLTRLWPHVTSTQYITPIYCHAPTAGLSEHPQLQYSVTTFDTPGQRLTKFNGF